MTPECGWYLPLMGISNLQPTNEGKYLMRTNHSFHLYFFIISGILLGMTTFAGESAVGPASPEHDKGWISAGLGWAEAPYELGVSLTANYGREHFWQIALNGSDKLNIFGINDNIELISLSISRGYSVSSRWSRLAWAAGPAIVILDQYNERKNRDEHLKDLGIVFNAQYYITPIKELGIGIELYGNLNGIQTVSGIRLIVALEGNK